MKIIFWGLGIFFSALGLTFIILYLNLLTMGYSFLEYVYFIIRKHKYTPILYKNCTIKFVIPQHIF